MRFLAVHSVFFFHENFVLRFRLFKFYLFVYFIVYRDPLYYTHFTEKIHLRHFLRWAGLHAHTRKKDFNNIRKYQKVSKPRRMIS